MLMSDEEGEVYTPWTILQFQGDFSLQAKLDKAYRFFI